MSKALSRKVAALTLAAAAGALSTTLLASPAHAHKSFVAGVGACDTATGKWKVTWTVTNTFNTQATLSDVVFTPAAAGAALPTTVPAKSNGQDGKAVSQPYLVPGNTTEAMVEFKASWSDGYHETVKGTAKLEGRCVAPTTPPATTPATPSAPAPPGLPVTGTPTGALLGTGAALVAGGAGLVFFLRRRRRVTFVAD